MRFCVLGSGSKGNATLVESNDTRILIDAGFSGVEIERRLARIGVDPATLSAILVTHEHNDHIKSIGILSRKHQLTIYATLPTLNAAAIQPDRLFRFVQLFPGTTLTHHHLAIHPFSISHDAVDPVGYVISDGNVRMGYCTDTGRVTRLMQHRLAGCHGLVLECNHDPEMLKNGSYPEPLKQRIRSNSGHLHNEESLRFLKDLLHDELMHVVFAHVSESNNDVKIIQRVIADTLAEPRQNGCRLKVSIAGQDEVSSIVRLSD